MERKTCISSPFFAREPGQTLGSLGEVNRQLLELLVHTRNPGQDESNKLGKCAAL